VDPDFDVARTWQNNVQFEHALSDMYSVGIGASYVKGSMAAGMLPPTVDRLRRLPFLSGSRRLRSGLDLVISSYVAIAMKRRPGLVGRAS
jgi:hypothetical protein